MSSDAARLPVEPALANAAEKSKTWSTVAPANGPIAIPRNVHAPTIPSARERAGPSYRKLAPAVASGTMAPPPMPWITRAAMSWSSDCATPDRADPTANRPSASMKRRGSP